MLAENAPLCVALIPWSTGYSPAPGLWLSAVSAALLVHEMVMLQSSWHLPGRGCLLEVWQE